MSDHLLTLQQLLPQGDAWNQTNPETIMYGVLASQAIGLNNIEQQITDFLVELHPGLSTELLAEWLTELGLPGTCAAAPETDDEKRALAWATLTQTGGASKAYFIALAKRLGYTIGISNNYPAQPFVWTVTTPLERIITARHGEARHANKYITRSAGAIECVFENLKPAHTLIEWKYQGAILNEDNRTIVNENNLALLF